MPFTVITLKNVPPSLRGDLTKWMQEIATGVYVGNFSARVRDNLWKRVCDAVGTGEATLSYMCHNEIGYDFQTLNSERSVIDYDGIPLVLLPKKVSEREETEKGYGYSKAYKLHKARQFSSSVKKQSGKEGKETYVAVDIETTGLDETRDQILELGAVKCKGGEITCYHRMIQIQGQVPQTIEKMTGITSAMTQNEGIDIRQALVEFIDFVGSNMLVGYNVGFDLKFLNFNLTKYDMPLIHNKTSDLMKTVKKEKMFQRDYKLQTSLESYGIHKKVPHRALEDAKLIYELSTKVNKI